MARAEANPTPALLTWARTSSGLAIEEEPPQIRIAGSLDQGPENASAAVRDFLGVSLERQSTWRTDYEAFKQWRLLIENTGILTFQANGVETAEARGFSISERPLP